MLRLSGGAMFESSVYSTGSTQVENRKSSRIVD